MTNLHPSRAQRVNLRATSRPFSAKDYEELAERLTPTTVVSRSEPGGRGTPAARAPKPARQAVRTAGGGSCDRPSTCPQLRQCENGGSYGSTGNGYIGAYQMAPGTAASVGYNGNQDAAADAIYAKYGRSQWPVCGRYLK